MSPIKNLMQRTRFMIRRSFPHLSLHPKNGNPISSLLNAFKTSREFLLKLESVQCVPALIAAP